MFDLVAYFSKLFFFYVKKFWMIFANKLKRKMLSVLKSWPVWKKIEQTILDLRDVNLFFLFNTYRSYL